MSTDDVTKGRRPGAATPGCEFAGHWSDLQLLQAGPTELTVARVGFPDTLTTLGSTPDTGD